MSNLQVLIENVKTSLTFSETVPVDQIRLHARDYAEACVELNRRMQQCIPFLHEGNLQEAVRLAEQAPNIPSVYALLDFPEREDWLEVVSTLDLDEPPPLLAHLCQRINDAYVAASGLTPLLRNHRLYALNHAPLRERLAVLRAIAKADAENTFWRDDLEEFEKARKDELKTEVNEVLASEDIGRIQALNSELTAQPWLTPCPPEWHRSLCGVILQSYSGDIQRHHAAFDEAEVANVYTAMQQVLKRNSLSMPAVIAQAVKPALTWLNDTRNNRKLEQDFNKCVAVLQVALERDSVPPTLQRLYYNLREAAGRARREIPNEVTTRYDERISSHETGDRRRTQLVIGGIIGACCLVAIVVALMLSQRNAQEQETHAIASLQQIEQRQAFDELERTINSVAASTVKRPKVNAEIGRLRDLQKQDELRAQKFQRDLNYLTGNIQDALSQDLAAAKKLESALQALAPLARTNDEQLSLNDVKASYDRLRRTKQQETDDAFRAALAAVTGEFATLRDTRHTPLEERVDSINELLAQIGKIGSPGSLDAVSDSLKTLHAEQLKAVMQFRSDALEEQRQDVAFRAIATHTGDWQKFHNAVASFAASATKHPAGTDAKTVANELVTIQDVATSLQKLSQDFTTQAKDFASLHKAAPSLAKRFTDEVLSKMDAQTADQLFPVGTLLAEWVKAVPLSPTSLKDSESLLKSLTQREVWVWVKPSGEWYYLLGEPAKSGDYRYITAFDARDKAIPLRDNFSSTKESQPTGITQYPFAKDALDKTAQIKGNTDAVPVVCKLISDAMMSDGLDPILKCILLNTLITDVSKIDPSFASTYAPVAKVLAASGVNFTATTPWMNVDSTNTPTQRKRAEAALQQSAFSNVSALAEQAIKKQEELQASLDSRDISFEWVGLLTYQNSVCSVTLKTANPISGGGELYVLRSSPTQNSKVNAAKIGTLGADGSVRIAVGNTTHPQCLPVFLLTK